ncbi:MAG: aldehyde dehydrogenase family protein, partial [Streptosporangiaceae bacterium]
MATYEGFAAMPLGGRWRLGSSGKTSADTDPWNGAVLAEIPLASAGDLDEAFTAAASAQRDWAAQRPAHRAEVMLAAAALMQDRKAEITRWLIRETGAPVGQAELEWSLTRSGMLRAASVPHQVAGRIMPSDLPGQESRVYRRPAGVIAVISPWRFPLQLANRSVAPALAAGNAVVLKPASDTPVAGGLLLARIYEQAGLPPGLLSVVIGSGDVIGDAMARHQLPEVISFCGSAATGRALARQAGLKRLVLGFGGPGPLVIMADADLGRAVDAALFGSVVRPGQVCLMASRLVVDRKVYHEFAERLVTAAGCLRAGDPAAENTDIGPLINARQLSLTQDLLERARAGGARQVLGGAPGGPAGLVLPPHVLLAGSDVAAAREE